MLCTLRPSSPGTKTRRSCFREKPATTTVGTAWPPRRPQKRHSRWPSPAASAAIPPRAQSPPGQHHTARCRGGGGRRRRRRTRCRAWCSSCGCSREVLAAGCVGGEWGGRAVDRGLVDAARVGERGRGPALSPPDARNVPRTERIEGVGVVPLSGKEGRGGRILRWCWVSTQGGGPHLSVAARRTSNSEYGGRQWEQNGGQKRESLFRNRIRSDS